MQTLFRETLRPGLNVGLGDDRGNRLLDRPRGRRRRRRARRSCSARRARTPAQARRGERRLQHHAEPEVAFRARVKRRPIVARRGHDRVEPKVPAHGNLPCHRRPIGPDEQTLIGSCTKEHRRVVVQAGRPRGTGSACSLRLSPLFACSRSLQPACRQPQFGGTGRRGAGLAGRVRITPAMITARRRQVGLERGQCEHSFCHRGHRCRPGLKGGESQTLDLNGSSRRTPCRAASPATSRPAWSRCCISARARRAARRATPTFVRRTPRPARG